MAKLTVNLRKMDISKFASVDCKLVFPSVLQKDSEALYAPNRLIKKTNEEGIAEFELIPTNNVTPVKGDRASYVLTVGNSEVSFVMPDRDVNLHDLDLRSDTPEKVKSLTDEVESLNDKLAELEAKVAPVPEPIVVAATRTVTQAQLDRLTSVTIPAASSYAPRNRIHVALIDINSNICVDSIYTPDLEVQTRDEGFVISGGFSAFAPAVVVTWTVSNRTLSNNSGAFFVSCYITRG